MATELDKARIEAILESAAQCLDGDWLLLGGALVAVWINPKRRTEDIDLVGLRGFDDRRRLLDFAVSLGVPVEALNSAADFFLEKFEGWRDELALWRDGPKGRIFRPTPTLFLCLKARRLSEQDLEDCKSVLALARKEHLAVNVKRVVATLDSLPDAEEQSVIARRAALRRAVMRPGPSSQKKSRAASKRRKK